MSSIDITRACLIANMKRVLELLEGEELDWCKDYKEIAELKNKMHEIRRDAIKLEKHLKY